jgi:hypothetical protein
MTSSRQADTERNVQQAVPFLTVHDRAALQPSRPFVGNGYWVVELEDPDGYKLYFESPTDVAEGTVL